jgi:hypothetical protein
MKKFILVCAILFIANVGCKKMNLDGGGVCGCLPIEGPEFNLVIKNSAGDDLLSSSTAGPYSKDNIQMYRKDNEGKMIPILFAIRPPFSYGDEKFKYNFLYTTNIRISANTQTDHIYLKLGNDQPYEMTLHLKSNGRLSVQRLLIDQKETEKEADNLSKYASFFYLNK